MRDHDNVGCRTAARQLFFTALETIQYISDKLLLIKPKGRSGQWVAESELRRWDLVVRDAGCMLLHWI